MEENKNYAIYTKEQLEKLSLEELKKAREYVEYYKNCYQELVDNPEKNAIEAWDRADVKEYEDQLNIIDGVISQKSR